MQHKASKDFVAPVGFARGSEPARVEMGGPINRQFSTLAAMTVDGMVGWDITELARSSTATNMPKAMDTMGFLNSFCRCVLGVLRPFPQPNSVLICGAQPLSHPTPRPF